MNVDLYNQLDSILKNQNRPEEERNKIFEAFKFAYILHDGQYRVSEEPYIIHPVEVAKILAELQADTPTVIAALLHDILEDTDTEPEELENKFGTDVLKLVNGVTKLSKYKFKSKEERQAESFRKMFISMAEDVRVIFLKLADRLHNMRTLNYMAPHKQKRIAEETLEIFAPLANRLGIGKIKAELEDLSLRYKEPEKYYEIAKSVAQTKADRDDVVQAIIDRIQTTLNGIGIDSKITGRAKHYYSIYAKMLRQQKDIHELYDITAVRVLVNTEKECYEVLGLIHSTFKPIPGRFKDYIAMPKSNLYRSLHTSVIGPRGKPVEVQIRTHSMHEEAEYGIAAHWKYKENGPQKTDDVDQKFTWLRKLIEMQEDVSDAKEYVNLVKLDLFSDQVFAFTPMGDVFDLPNGATPIDFAYRIHTEVGHKTQGAIVNGKIVPLDTKLENGDIIEILTGKQPNPRLDWINIVATNAAKSKIKQWFRKNKKEEHISIGKSNLEQELGKAKFDEHHKNDEFNRIAKELNYLAEDDLFAAVGYGETTTNKVINKLARPEPEEQFKIRPRTQRGKSKKAIIGLEGMLYHIAKCCSPIPGEPIIGVVTRSRGVSVHRIDCVSLDSIPQERMMKIEWAGADINKTYIVNARIEAHDRLGVLQDVLAKIADNKTNIVFANVKSKLKKFAIIDLGLEITDIDNLQKVFNSIQQLADVISVKRVQSTTSSRR